MFLHDLREDQQRAFLKIAREFMRVDGVKPEEKDLMETFCRETGLELDDATDGKVPELLPEFDSRKARVSMMLELIGLGYIDREFSDDEKAFLHRFLEEFGWDASEFDVLENWVLRQISLMQDAEELRTTPEV